MRWHVILNLPQKPLQSGGNSQWGECWFVELFFCVSFDCFIELQAFPQVVQMIAEAQAKKNGYPSTKLKKAKQKQESYKELYSLFVFTV